MNGQNNFVLRPILVLGLAAVLWATTPRSGPFPLGAALTVSGVEACVVTGGRHDTGSDQQWRTAHHATAVVTGSVWKSAPVHAGLGATRIARIFEMVGFINSPDPPAASTPPYLLHTPLLI